VVKTLMHSSRHRHQRHDHHSGERLPEQPRSLHDLIGTWILHALQGMEPGRLQRGLGRRRTASRRHVL